MRLLIRSELNLFIRRAVKGSTKKTERRSQTNWQEQSVLIEKNSFKRENSLLSNE